MKKFLVILVVIITALAVAVYFIVPGVIVGMITSYEPYTFEYVVENDSLPETYGIYDNRSPADYGFENFEEVDFSSYLDSLPLNGWYVSSAPNSSKCIVMVHGRTSNRLKTMKYLQLFHETGLDTIYNVFIPDLRNSGKSSASSTFMGYKFAEDVAGSLQFINQNFNQDSVILFGFSMGAQASAGFMHRPALNGILADRSIHIEKLIFDCPLSNVKATLKVNADEMGLPGFIFEKAYGQFCEEIENYCDNQALSVQLADIETPVLILASTDDTTTPYSILQFEMTKLQDNSFIHLEEFSGIQHVRIYQDEAHQARYTQLVDEFIRR